MNLDFLQNMIVLTVTNPRAAARQVIAMNLPIKSGWTALLLVAVLSALFGFLGFLFFPIDGDPLLAALFGSPFNTALIQIAVQFITAFLVWAVGTKFGGVGSLSNAVAVVAWVQVPLIVLQVVQLVAMALSPPLASIMGLAGLMLYALILSQAVAELHGFRSAVVVLFGILGVSFAFTVVAAVFAALVLGVSNA